MYRRFSFVIGGVAWFFAAGCVGPLPQPDAEQKAAHAVMLPSDQPLVFRIEPDPEDVQMAESASLDVGTVLQVSVLRSAEVQAALARVKVAQAESQLARQLPNPIISLAVRFPEGGAGKPVIDAGLTADLLKVLRRPGSVAAADARLRAAGSEVVRIVLDVVASAQQSYYDIQAGEASLVVLRERVGLLQRLLDLADARLRIGEGTRLDVITLQTQRVELDAEIAEAEMQVRDARLALARLMGVPSSDAIWTLHTWKPNDEVSLDETAYIRVALINRPEVQEREWELLALGAERRLAHWDVLSGSDAGVAAERDGDWSIGPSATLPIPLFDTGAASRDKATAAAVEARHQLTSTRRQIVEEVRRAFSSLTLTQANLVRIRDELIPLQERRLSQAEAQFAAGQTDITALLLAEQDLRGARIKLIDLQHRAVLAQVRLDRAVGGAGAVKRAAPTTRPSASNPEPAP